MTHARPSLPEPITTLLDRRPAPEPALLPEELRAAYGGDLRFPPAPAGRPYVAGNFVGTLDGVVSFEAAGKSGGGNISGFDEADRFIMGLLRASADAVIVGKGTLHATAPAHLFVGGYVYPQAGALFARYREEVLRKPAPPLNVVVSGSGDVDLSRAVFRTPQVPALLITTEAGRESLCRNGTQLPACAQVRTLAGPPVAPAAILDLLRAEFGVSLLLHEGGPVLFGDFLAHGLVDELFLTVAPQLAGRGTERPRPGVIAGVEFSPETAPWLEIVSVKQRANHLYLRYAMRET